MNPVEETKRFVQEEMEGVTAGHGWQHVKRVWEAAQSLAEVEGADTLVVSLAALLHDVDDYKVSGSDEGVRGHLKTLGPDPETVKDVCRVVENVSFRGGVDDAVDSIEGAVVQDADRLDAIGAIGVARAFAYSGERGNPLHDCSESPREYESVEEYKNAETTTVNHFYEKLLRLKERMKTDTARAIAEDRHAFMEEFLDKFFEEWDGEDLP